MLSRGYRSALVATMLAGMSGAAAGQNPAANRIDEGSYRITIDGTDDGTERFVIRRTGTSADALIEATGRVSIDARPDVLTAVRIAAETLRAADYQVRIEGTPAEIHSGRVAGRRVTARVVSSAGENLREYLVSEGAEVIDESVAHQHYFLARRVRNGETRIPVISPREGRQHFVQVEVAGDETLTIAGQSVTARKLVIRPEQGEVRNVWVDGQDRVLKLELPARRLLAERAALPS
jgi:hypothetical protein